MSSKSQNVVSQWINDHLMSGKVARQVVIMAILLVVLGAGFGLTPTSASAHGVCADGDTVYTVRSGDTLGAIAKSNHISTQQLASYNKISDASFILLGQNICIPGSGAKTTHKAAKPVAKAPAKRAAKAPAKRAAKAPAKKSAAILGTYNPFAYGQCTYWADARYHQLHGVYVPWVVNSNASQWVVRAQQYHWSVSSTPSVGSIMVIAPGVQGAWSDGHVAIVESMKGRSVVASSMNWDGSGSNVNRSTFTAGAGVHFIRN